MAKPIKKAFPNKEDNNADCFFSKTHIYDVLLTIL